MLDVIVVDDHVGVRKAVTWLLRREPRIRLVGECGDGAEAVALATALQPDIALVDLSMRQMHGFEVARRIGAATPKTRILLMTAHDVAAIRASTPEAALYEIIAKARVASDLIATLLAIGSAGFRQQGPAITDAERRAALQSYRVLRTDPEPVYNEITATAAERTGCPISVMTLVDADQQWFKARFGCDKTGVPRDLAFCTHTIQDPTKLFVVPDALLDPRFSRNPLVTGSYSLRSYAGAPLVNAAGVALGTLCVIDRKPRIFTEDDGVLLHRLAARVMTALELRKTAL